MYMKNPVPYGTQGFGFEVNDVWHYGPGFPLLYPTPQGRLDWCPAVLVQGVCYQRQPEEVMLQYVVALTV